MPLIDTEPPSMMTSFHVAERANSVHISGGIFSLCADRKNVYTAWMLIMKPVRVAQSSGTKTLHCHLELSKWNTDNSNPEDK